MDKAFAVFGKIVIIVALVGGVAYGAYRMGRQGVPSSPEQFGAVSVTATPTPDHHESPQNYPLATEPSPTTKTSKIVTAGLDASSGLSFAKYQVTVPDGWTPNHTTTNQGTWVDTLTLTKGAASIKIFQAATGGAMCMYPGDPAFEGPSSSYDTFVDLTTADGTKLRRGTTNVNNGQTKGFTMCQKNSEGSFGQPTGYGHMSLTTALNPDAALLAEVDAMISSLKKL